MAVAPAQMLDDADLASRAKLIAMDKAQVGQPVMSHGAMGAILQPQRRLQTLACMLDCGQSPQTACDAPRWRFKHGY